MPYLDLERLAALDARTFREERPFPWINPERLITERGYERLLESLPELSLFTPEFGRTRAFGQDSHDRYVLEYREGLDLAGPWRDFIEELRGAAYRAWLEQLIGTRPLALRFHWHYTPPGSAVSPHCDSRSELGTHIFYFLGREGDWREDWGGQTLILDDGQGLDLESAPRFEDFRSETAARVAGNRSLLFARTEHSWHGMRGWRAPGTRLRRIFSVVICGNRLSDRWRRFTTHSRKDFY